MSTLYSVVGATIGILEGFLAATKDETTEVIVAARQQAFANLAHLQKQTGVVVDTTVHNAYIVAGACSGILRGLNIALLSFWWYVTDDEIKAKLLQQSPVKYPVTTDTFSPPHTLGLSIASNASTTATTDGSDTLLHTSVSRMWKNKKGKSSNGVSISSTGPTTPVNGSAAGPVLEEETSSSTLLDNEEYFHGVGTPDEEDVSPKVLT